MEADSSLEQIHSICHQNLINTHYNNECDNILEQYTHLFQLIITFKKSTENYQPTDKELQFIYQYLNNEIQYENNTTTIYLLNNLQDYCKLNKLNNFIIKVLAELRRNYITQLLFHLILPHFTVQFDCLPSIFNLNPKFILNLKYIQFLKQTDFYHDIYIDQVTDQLNITLMQVQTYNLMQIIPVFEMQQLNIQVSKITDLLSAQLFEVIQQKMLFDKSVHIQNSQQFKIQLIQQLVDYTQQQVRLRFSDQNADIQVLNNLHILNNADQIQNNISILKKKNMMQNFAFIHVKDIKQLHQLNNDNQMLNLLQFTSLALNNYNKLCILLVKIQVIKQFNDNVHNDFKYKIKQYINSNIQIQSLQNNIKPNMLYQQLLKSYGSIIKLSNYLNVLNLNLTNQCNQLFDQIQKNDVEFEDFTFNNDFDIFLNALYLGFEIIYLMLMQMENLFNLQLKEINNIAETKYLELQKYEEMLQDYQLSTIQQ